MSDVARLTVPDGKKADLVLEGGGVKGIGLVGAVLALDKADYQFPRVAARSPRLLSPRCRRRASRSRG